MITELKKWVLDKNLEETSLKGFWENFNDWKEEEPKEFYKTFTKKYDPEKLYVYLNMVSLAITNWPAEDYNHVVVSIKFDYDETAIGEYKMVFDYPTGEIDDDIFRLIY